MELEERAELISGQADRCIQAYLRQDLQLLKGYARGMNYILEQAIGQIRLQDAIRRMATTEQAAQQVELFDQ